MNSPWLPPGPARTSPAPPDPAGGDWADIVRGQLFDRRTVVIRGVLDDSAANQAAAELMTLDATGDSRVTLHVDASGGTIEAAFAVMDVIDLLGVPVHILCVGRAEGPAAGVVAVGSRRACTPHTRFRLVDPDASMTGSAADLARWAEHHLDRVRRFHERVASAVHRPTEQVAADCAAGRYLSAEEALDYGLVDEIASRRATVYPLTGRSVGFRPD